MHQREESDDTNEESKEHVGLNVHRDAVGTLLLFALGWFLASAYLYCGEGEGGAKRWRDESAYTAESVFCFRGEAVCRRVLKSQVDPRDLVQSRLQSHTRLCNLKRRLN